MRRASSGWPPASWLRTSRAVAANSMSGVPLHWISFMREMRASIRLEMSSPFSNLLSVMAQSASPTPSRPRTASTGARRAL